MARGKKHTREDDEAVAKPPPPVGTSLKALLKDVSLEPAKPSRGTSNPAQGTAKPSQSTSKPSQGTSKVSKPQASPSRAVAASTASPGTPAPGGPPETPAARPSDTLRGDDRIAFFDAIAGVRSLDAGRPRPKLAVPVRTADPSPAPPRADIDAPARQKLGALVAGAHRFDVAVEEDGFVEGLRRDAPIEALGALRRAEPRIDATLDLHGLREAVVEDRLARWLRESHRKGARRVLVIHGKGLHSADGVAILREAVLRVLQASIATPLVLAFASAPPAMGGTGATLVELTKERG